MSEFGAAVAAPAPAASAASPAPGTSPQTLAPLHSLEFSSRANSGNSVLSQEGSASGESQQAAPQLAAGPSGSGELDAAASTSGSEAGGDKGMGITSSGSGTMVAGAAAAGLGGVPVKKDDAKSSALKALAGVSAIVSKSRKVDAEALQAIKSQRAKARAEGHPPSAAAAGVARSGNTPPPPGSLSDAGGPSVSPFASASSQGLVRTPSASNLAGALHGGPGLGQAASLPVSVSMGAGGHGPRPRRSPVGTPPAAASDYESMVNKMTITELVALKQAVESQLAKQAMALAQLHTSSHSPQTDMLSQQYAALLLQNAQQAQLVQQLNSQQQAAHAAAIQQALSAAAAAAGITSQSFSPEQLLLSQQQPGAAGGPPPGGLTQYGSLPIPDMSSPFASAPFPSDASFGLADAGGRASVSLPPGAGGVASSKSSGSPRSASAEQQLIGEALHSFVDPERQGPPSRQGSALVNGINWSDRRAAVVGGGGGPPPAPSAAFARSRSLPHPQDALYQDRSASLNTFLGDEQQLGSLFNGLRMDALPPGDGSGGGAPPSAFAAAARAGSLQVPLRPGPSHVSFSENVQTRTFQPSY